MLWRLLWGGRPAGWGDTISALREHSRPDFEAQSPRSPHELNQLERGIPTSPADEAPDDNVPIERRFFDVRTLASFLIGIALLFFIVTRTNIAVADVLSTIRSADP